jgi:4-amino-4-deoxy-L-arabinose transferase-like glycosyltransferase
MVKVNKFYIIIFIAILSLGSFFTFFHLQKRSLLDWDEAYYLEVIKTWRAVVDWFVYRIFKPTEITQVGFSDYMLEHGGAINTFAKDGFLAIVFLFSYFFGLRDITILWVNGIFGVLTVWLIYLIGKEMLGRIVGLLSCGILAISAYQLHYARSGFPQTVSVFFLYLAVFLYILSYKHKSNPNVSRRFLFFTGISLGYAFTCHYNLFWAIPSLFLLEVVDKFFSNQGMLFRNFVKRIFLLFAGALIPIFFWVCTSELVKFIIYLNPSFREAIRGSLGTGSFVSYFDRILNFLTPSLSVATSKGDSVYSTSQLGSLFYYVKLLLLWEGPLILTLLLMGIVRLIYRQIRYHIFMELIILILFLVPFLYWSFHSWQLSRSFVAAIPAVALILGSLLTQLVEKKYKREAHRVFTVFIILLLFTLQALARIEEELSYVSGYPAAIKFMKEHLGIRHLSSQYTISRFFVGRNNALDISVSFSKTNVKTKLKEFYNKYGYRYLLLDQMRHLFADSPIVKAADISQPVFIVPHSTQVNLFENNMLDFSNKVNKEPQILMVYELTDIMNNLKD